MISKTLMKQTVKANIVLFLVMTLVQAACLVLMAGIGQDVASTGRSYYKMLPGIMGAVYIIITGNKLLAAQVDKGTMAYILSTPVKRSKVAITQAVFFVVSLFIMFATSAAAHIVGSNLALENFSSGDLGLIIKLNLGMFALSLAFSGICFMASGLFNLSKYAISIGGGVVGAFLLLSLVSLFGEKLEALGDLTIVSLYDINSIVSGTSDYIWKLVILVGIGVITYITGITVFSKKDLPL